MNAPIYALHGLPRSGKDTLGRLLIGQGADRFTFASALYADVAQMFTVSIEDMQTEEWKRYPQDALANWRPDHVEYRRWLKDRGESTFEPRTSRYHLRLYGTEFCQSKFGVSYWANRLRLLLDAESDPGIPIVITDVRRYGNSFHEYDMLRGWAAQNERMMHMIRIVRDASVFSVDELHSSDADYPDSVIDLTIHNSGKPEDMLTQLDEFLSPKEKATTHA